MLVSPLILWVSRVVFLSGLLWLLSAGISYVPLATWQVVWWLDDLAWPLPHVCWLGPSVCRGLLVLTWPLILQQARSDLIYHLHGSVRVPGVSGENKPQSWIAFQASACIVCADAPLARATTRPVQGDRRKARHLRACIEVGEQRGCLCIYPKLLSQFGLFSGESNVNFNRDLYNCTFPALVEDWRQTFHDGSQGQTERFFPFGFVQVCAERKRVHGLWCRRCRWDLFPGIRLPFFALLACQLVTNWM